MVVKIINKSKFPLPSYAKPGDSGMDLRNIGEEFTLKPLERKLVPTGIYVQLPLELKSKLELDLRSL